MTAHDGAGITVDEIATVRTGDKGDTLIVGVVAREGIGFAELVSAITEEAVASHFGLPASRVTRKLLPSLHAMSFELRGMLGQGVTGLGHHDGHGKTLSYHLLAMPVAHRSPAHAPAAR